jgi:exodeoxyribonuclease VII small subunit
MAKEEQVPAQEQHAAATGEPATPKSFEAGLKELETIVREMESGELPLERALQLYESGMKLSEVCRKQLEEAETRVEILMKRGREVTAQPFPSK